MRFGPVVVGAALLALTACGGGGSPTASPSPTASATSPAPTGTPSPTAAAPSVPAGCEQPAPAAAGATVVTASVSGGRVTTERRRYDVALNSPVRLLVTADVADEVHVHGYDIKADIEPPCPAVVDFEARIPGSVEVELESSHLELFEIRAS